MSKPGTQFDHRLSGKKLKANPEGWSKPGLYLGKKRTRSKEKRKSISNSLFLFLVRRGCKSQAFGLDRQGKNFCFQVFFTGVGTLGPFAAGAGWPPWTGVVDGVGWPG